MFNIAIFASGSGSNAENIINFFNNDPEVQIRLIISNKSDAFVLERAKNLRIKSAIFSNSDFRETSKVLNFLKSESIDLVVLAGFLIKVPINLIEAFPNKIINIHPALLPKYGGRGMYGNNVHKAVVEAGEKESGITIHYINEEYDEGNIIFQAKCDISDSDTFSNVAEKVHALEYKYFPKIIKQVIKSML